MIIIIMLIGGSQDPQGVRLQQGEGGPGGGGKQFLLLFLGICITVIFCSVEPDEDTAHRAAHQRGQAAGLLHLGQ